MRVPPRFVVVVLFVTVGMLALVVAGLLDWIVGVLFLSMEFLGEVLRSVFRRRRARRHPPTRPRRASVVHPDPVEHHRGAPRRKGRPRRRRSDRPEGEPASAPAPAPALRVLVPVTRDEPGLLDFALEECRIRRAEMILLFLRPMAVTPMGPIPLPGLSEDDEARATFARVGSEADRVGVPLRTIYAATGDRPAAIGEFAGTCQVDVVVVGSPRRGRIARYLTRDSTPSILALLPERASLMIHAS